MLSPIMIETTIGSKKIELVRDLASLMVGHLQQMKKEKVQCGSHQHTIHSCAYMTPIYTYDFTMDTWELMKDIAPVLRNAVYDKLDSITIDITYMSGRYTTMGDVELSCAYTYEFKE